MKEKKERKIFRHLEDFLFILPNAKIYGGLQNSWEFGPHGVEIKRKIKELWWSFFISNNPFNVGYEGTIITHPKVLQASGHLENFSDWTVECLKCKKVNRIDWTVQLEEREKFFLEPKRDFLFSSFSCLNCSSSQHSFSENVSLLLKTEFTKKTFYLRPETCQSIFLAFPRIKRVLGRSLPFGIGQIGKSFRNEVTLRHGIFRMREFEQMELEFFFSTEDKKDWLAYWVEKAWVFLQRLFRKKENNNLSKKEIEKKELPFYSLQTIDFFYSFSFGEGEICSHSRRGEYDLKQHHQLSGVQVVELSFGLERLFLALLEDSLFFQRRSQF